MLWTWFARLMQIKSDSNQKIMGEADDRKRQLGYIVAINFSSQLSFSLILDHPEPCTRTVFFSPLKKNALAAPC